MIELTPRILQLTLLSLCGGFALIIASEVFALMPGDTAASNIAQRNAAAPAAIKLPENLDSMVAEILERPLFSASRAPADAPVSEDNDEEKKKPGRIQARLTGLIVRPGAREALFERDGDKAVAVKEGGEIDGWTVSSIRFDSVVLTSESGEQTLKPAIGQSSAPARPKVAAKKPAAPAAKKPNAPKAVAAAGQGRR